MVKIIIIFSIIIVLAVLILSVITTKKAYQFKHTIDPIEDNQHLQNDESEKNNGL